MFVTQNVTIVKFVMIFAYVNIYIFIVKEKRMSTKNEEIMFLVTLIRKFETLFILLAIFFL